MRGTPQDCMMHNSIKHVHYVCVNSSLVNFSELLYSMHNTEAVALKYITLLLLTVCKMYVHVHATCTCTCTTANTQAAYIVVALWGGKCAQDIIPAATAD